MVKIEKSNLYKLGYQVSLKFQVSQHVRDEKLIASFVEYFGVGRLEKDSKQLIIDFVVEKFPQLINTIIPFFQKYPILGAKSRDFNDFCKVAKLMKNKSHLRLEGLNEINNIKSG